MTDNWAVIPVKGLTESKTRLSTSLQGDQRRILVEALLEDVLASVVRSRVYGTIIVISSDENVRTRVKSQGVSFVKQTSVGLNRAIEQTNRLALQKHARSVTNVLGDIPLVDPGDFKEISSLGDASQRVVMAPSLKGGTNVMLTSPPGVVSPSYGRWSYSKHLHQAQVRGVNAYSISNSRISFDIDSSSDLIELRRRDPEGRTASGRVISEYRVLLNDHGLSLSAIS